MAPFDFYITDTCKKIHPESAMGVLVVGHISNMSQSDALSCEKKELVLSLRERYGSREAIKTAPVMQAYAAYYKQFKKNYHVFFQLESVAVKGKPIPHVNALVEAMFMAELKHGLLTAGHDLEKVEGAVRLDSAAGDELYITMGGVQKTLKKNDMFVADARGVLSSIIYGPDQRTQITEITRGALFTVYAPQGISQGSVHAHMQDIFQWIRLFSPQAELHALAVHSA